jgi:hypothetical protein
MDWRPILTAVLALAGSAALADGARQFNAVVCVSQAGAGWSEKARGTLTRTRSKETVIYELKAGEQTLTWRFVSAPPQGTTVIGPGFLMDVFAGDSAKPDEWPERKQSIYADGEIREEAPSSALRLVVGSKCPAARNKTRAPDTRRLQVEENRLVPTLHADVEAIDRAARELLAPRDERAAPLGGHLG